MGYQKVVAIGLEPYEITFKNTLELIDVYRIILCFSNIQIVTWLEFVLFLLMIPLHAGNDQ